MTSGDSQRRLFAAIPVPVKLKDAIGQFQESNPAQRTIWTRDYNLHITVYFIGNMAAQHVASITETIRELALSTEPFTLWLERITLAPPRKRPRMIWMQFGRLTLFTDLANRIHLALREFIPENPFHFREPVPHITLARFNSTFDTSQLNLGHSFQADPLSVTCCELWESTQTDRGVQYISIAKFPFRG